METTVSHMLWESEAEYVYESHEVEGQDLVPSFPHCQRQDLSNPVNLVSYRKKSTCSGVRPSNPDLFALPVANCMKNGLIEVRQKGESSGGILEYLELG